MLHSAMIFFVHNRIVHTNQLVLDTHAVYTSSHLRDTPSRNLPLPSNPAPSIIHCRRPPSPTLPAGTFCDTTTTTTDRTWVPRSAQTICSRESRHSLRSCNLVQMTSRWDDARVRTHTAITINMLNVFNANTLCWTRNNSTWTSTFTCLVHSEVRVGSLCLWLCRTFARGINHHWTWGGSWGRSVCMYVWGSTKFGLTKVEWVRGGSYRFLYLLLSNMIHYLVK